MSVSYQQMEIHSLLFCWESRGVPDPWAELETTLSQLPKNLSLSHPHPFSFLSPYYLTLENFPQCVLEISDQEVLEWYTAKDFIVGKPITILGRTFFIYDCDPFTRQYYKEKFGISDLPQIDVSKKEPPPVKQVMEH